MSKTLGVISISYQINITLFFSNSFNCLPFDIDSKEFFLKDPIYTPVILFFIFIFLVFFHSFAPGEKKGKTGSWHGVPDLPGNFPKNSSDIISH